MAGTEWTDGTRSSLLQAIETYDHAEVARLTEVFLTHVRQRSEPYPTPDAKKLLGALKNKRFFEQLASTAEVLIEFGQDAPVIRRLMAQGLIEQGKLIVARDLLLRLEEQTRSDIGENAEARGLLGRVHKQLYVRQPNASQAQRRSHIATAVDWYASAYVADRTSNYWHGINTVACVMRAARDGIALEAPESPEVTARRILDLVPGGQAADAWRLATAMEACVALNDADRALAYAHEYVKRPDADAFELGSTLRQLREVWQLTLDREPGTSLLTLLEANLLQRTGGRVDTTRGDAEWIKRMATSGYLQARFSPGEFTKLQWLADAVRGSQLVASVSNRFNTPIGSGFVVWGDTLHASFGHRPVLVTNSHVLGGPAARDKQALILHDARVRFQMMGPEVYFCKGDLLFTSPYHELDVSVVALCRDRQLDAIATLSAEPLRWWPPPPMGDRKVYVVGHPGGRELEVSMEDNLLLACAADRIHYRSATEEGSSGSAVFDDTWQLIAIHHAGSPTMPRLEGEGHYQANEGILLEAISAKCQARLG
jgi:hypothetical protein